MHLTFPRTRICGKARRLGRFELLIVGTLSSKLHTPKPPSKKCPCFSMKKCERLPTDVGRILFLLAPPLCHLF